MTLLSLPGHKENAAHNNSTEDMQTSVYPDHHEINITEGSEFLDDAIRTTDQPFGATEPTKRTNTKY